MSGEEYRPVVETAESSDARVVAYLRTRADGSGVVKGETFRTIAKGARIARSTSHRSLARLRQAGVITAEVGGYGLVITLLGGEQ